MLPSPDKRQVSDILDKGEKIGKLLGIEKVATFNMTWKEPRIDLPGGGECYPRIDVLERISELISKPARGKKQKRTPKLKDDMIGV